MTVPKEQQRNLLLRVARQAMKARGFETEFSDAALVEVEKIKPLTGPIPADLRDLRPLPWCSIDNDDSRDLDQLTVAVPLDGGKTRIMVAVADVSGAVKPGSALDRHAGINTTSVYTPPQNFPMLPDPLSTDLTSLVAGRDRMAMIVDLVIDEMGAIDQADFYPAVVRNQAKLAYPSLGAWLEGTGPIPASIPKVPGLEENLKLQDQVAQSLKARRQEFGALDLETVEVRTQFDGGAVSQLLAEKPNRAKQIIEDFMIAANCEIARFLKEKGYPVLRRIVRSPQRWQRIVDIALTFGEKLPVAPDARSLNEFLLKRRAADPLRFPDLSLSVIKLLGRGEYVASFPNREVSGHFGLAVSQYTHSTAPNRRYPDLITQRLLKAALANKESPYAPDQLYGLAARCTQKEDDAQKVERLMRKAAAACLLSGHTGQEFDGIVTGAAAKGTWVRIFEPPVEGRILKGVEWLDVGDKVRVKLLNADPESGFIDFANINPMRGSPSKKH